MKNFDKAYLLTQDSLAQDSDFQSPLQRVNFAPGMLLGVEATNAEQGYHRRRLNRHDYWLHGAGTVLGFAVQLEHEEVEPSVDDVTVKLLVTPGVGIDGLGREVNSFEPYCINLNQWLASQIEDEQGNAALLNGLNDAQDSLSLLITMRQRDCASGLQPVLARKVNAGTDPVAPSRTTEGVLLEINAARLNTEQAAWPWNAHQQHSSPVTELLNDTEMQYLAQLAGAAKKRAQHHSGLVYALAADPQALAVKGESAEIAKTLLAHIEIAIRSDQLPLISPVINPHHIALNNLVRPFVNSADALTWLSQEES
ncbi:MAG: hypothetical protein V7784_07715 [Oceanospirillaceae bacterium]